LLRVRLKQLQDRSAAQDAVIADLEGRVAALTREGDALKRDKEVLLTNISSLFNTAKLEIERKDNEIKELRERLARAQAGSKAPSGKEGVERGHDGARRGPRNGAADPERQRQRSKSRECQQIDRSTGSRE
jgi:uncharacterized coiled-coil protein SlyX